MRLVHGVAGLCLSGILFAACSSAEADPYGSVPVGPGGPGGSGDGGSTLGDGALGGDGGPSGPGALKGFVVRRKEGLALAARAVKVRDATGKVQDLTTDTAGGFSANGVVAPYDLWVAPSGPSNNSLSTTYLGLRAMNIKVHGDATESPAPAINGTNIALSWTVPTCGGGSCRLELGTRCADGSVTTGGHPGRPSGEAYSQSYPISWFGAPNTTCEISVLLISADKSTYYFFRTNVAVQKDVPAAAPMVVPAGTPIATASVTATTTAPGSWPAPNATLNLVLPAPAGSFELLSEAVPSAPTSLPVIAGSTVTVNATQTFTSGSNFALVGATLVGAAPAATTYNLQLGDPTPLVAPVENGQINLSNGSFDFRAAPEPRIRMVTWVGPSGPGHFVILGEPKLALSRLAGLGPALTPAGVTLIAEEQTGSLDEYVSDVMVVRSTRFAKSSYSIVMPP